MNSVLNYCRFCVCILGFTASAAGEGVTPSDLDRYNDAVEMWVSGETDRARQTFEQLSGSERDEIAARARYNLGNLRYAEALQTLQSDANQAVASLQDAITLYRSALEIAPSDQDARANVELAMQLISQLQPPPQKQPNSSDQEPQENQDQDSQSPPKQESEKQESEKSESEKSESEKSEPEKSEPEKSESQQDSGPPKESEEQSDPQPESSAAEQAEKDTPGGTSMQASQDSSESEPSQPEQAGGDETEPSERNPSPSEPESPDNTAAENPSSTNEQGSDSQSMQDDLAQQQQDAPTPSDADTPQESASDGKLSAANAASLEAQEGGDPGKPTSMGIMTQDEANKMLQAIRDRELLRRLRNQRAQQRRHVPVDKDW